MSEVQLRGQKARELLENETFGEVFDLIANECIREIRGSAAGATALREMSAANLRGLDTIKALLKRWVDDAEHERKQAEKAQERSNVRRLR